MNLNVILILVCFAFPGEPNECGIATLTPTTPTDNTTAEVIDVYCTAARYALAAQYPGAKLVRCAEWEGTPLGSTET